MNTIVILNRLRAGRGPSRWPRPHSPRCRAEALGYRVERGSRYGDPDHRFTPARSQERSQSTGKPSAGSRPSVQSRWASGLLGVWGGTGQRPLPPLPSRYSLTRRTPERRPRISTCHRLLPRGVSITRTRNAPSGFSDRLARKAFVPAAMIGVGREVGPGRGRPCPLAALARRP